MSQLTTQDIQEDWKRREFLEIIQLNIMKIVQFLNEFDASVRERLGRMNSKLNRIERNLDYCESSFEAAEKGGEEI